MNNTPRHNGTNPRAQGTAPRQQNTNPRSEALAALARIETKLDQLITHLHHNPPTPPTHTPTFQPGTGHLTPQPLSPTAQAALHQLDTGAPE